MTIRIEQETEVPFDFDYCTLAKETVVCSLDQEAFPYEAEVGLTLTDAASIQEINRRYGRSTGRRMFCRFLCLPYRQREILRESKTVLPILIRIPERRFWAIS